MRFLEICETDFDGCLWACGTDYSGCGNLCLRDGTLKFDISGAILETTVDMGKTCKQIFFFSGKYEYLIKEIYFFNYVLTVILLILFNYFVICYCINIQNSQCSIRFIR